MLFAGPRRGTPVPSPRSVASGAPLSPPPLHRSPPQFALEYRFYPAIPEPMELRAAFSVFYEDGEQYFTTTFFNETLVRELGGRG